MVVEWRYRRMLELTSISQLRISSGISDWRSWCQGTGVRVRLTGGGGGLCGAAVAVVVS